MKNIFNNFDQMKHIFLLSALIFTTLMMSAQEVKTQPERKTETRIIGPFDKIRTVKGINVTLIEGDKEKVEIQIENAEPADVITTLEGKTLILKMKTMIKKGVAVQVYVTYNRLIEIQAGTAATIDAEGPVHADKLTLSVGVDAVIMLDVDVNSLKADLSAGRIEISGTSKSIEVVANTGGKFNASALQTDVAFIKTNTGAQATVRVSNRLTGVAGAGSKIYYYGTPKVEKSESLGGKVLAAEE
jgi:hypothetical protein